MNSMLLPLSCVSSGPCNDTSSIDYGVVMSGILAAVAVIAAILLSRRGHSGWAVVLGLILVGLSLAAVLAPRPYAWFAYTPGSEEVFVSAPLGALAIYGLLAGAAGLFALGCGVAGVIVSKKKETPTDA